MRTQIIWNDKSYEQIRKAFKNAFENGTAKVNLNGNIYYIVSDMYEGPKHSSSELSKDVSDAIDIEISEGDD